LTAEASPVGWGWQTIAFVCRALLFFCYQACSKLSIGVFTLTANELDATAYEFGAPLYRPRTKPKACGEVS